MDAVGRENMKYIDLHTHSIMSDGSMSPAEVVRHAKEAGLTAMALSDHDTVDGVEEAVEEGKRIGIEVVPAIELSAQSATETHVLGYYIDIHNDVLTSTLARVRKARVQRNVETCEKLNELGFKVTMEEAKAKAPAGVIGRAHFASVMVDKGYVGSVKEAFDKYLANGRAAFSSNQLLTVRDCIDVINAAGGGAFIAHVHLIRLGDEELEKFLSELIPCGLKGIEGYYTEYTQEMQDKYQLLAKKLGLAISGGTDFHAKMKPHISIGTGLGNMHIPYSVLENIRKALGKD